MLTLALIAGSAPESPDRTVSDSSSGGRAWAPFAYGVAATAEGEALRASPAGPDATALGESEDGHAVPGVRTGTASTYGPGWEGWIAWPGGPGWKLRVCGPGGCVVVVTTDAGPGRAMQRAGRILDLDVATFERVAGVSWTVGLAKVRVTILGKVGVARVVDPDS